MFRPKHERTPSPPKVTKKWHQDIDIEGDIIDTAFNSPDMTIDHTQPQPRAKNINTRYPPIKDSVSSFSFDALSLSIPVDNNEHDSCSTPSYKTALSRASSRSSLQSSLSLVRSHNFSRVKSVLSLAAQHETTTITTTTANSPKETMDELVRNLNELDIDTIAPNLVNEDCKLRRTSHGAKPRRPDLSRLRRHATESLPDLLSSVVIASEQLELATSGELPVTVTVISSTMNSDDNNDEASATQNNNTLMSQAPINRQPGLRRSNLGDRNISPRAAYNASLRSAAARCAEQRQNYIAPIPTQEPAIIKNAPWVNRLFYSPTAKIVNHAPSIPTSRSNLNQRARHLATVPANSSPLANSCMSSTSAPTSPLVTLFQGTEESEEEKLEMERSVQEILARKEDVQGCTGGDKRISTASTATAKDGVEIQFIGAKRVVSVVTVETEGQSAVAQEVGEKGTNRTELLARVADGEMLGCMAAAKQRFWKLCGKETVQRKMNPGKF